MSSDRLFIILKQFALVAFAGFVLTACTVQPLYRGGNGDAANLNVAPTIRQKLSAIQIDAPDDRFNQLVRNRLIFLLGGGAGEPDSPTYLLSLNASYSIRLAVQVDIGDTTKRAGRASAGTVNARSHYALKDGDGKPVVQRTRAATSSFDRPRQEYANLAAEQDAVRRAAEELAEQVYLSLAQDVSKL